MFFSYVPWRLHSKVRESLVKVTTERDVLKQQVASMHTMVGFLCQQVNQLQVERAAWIKKATNVDVNVANIMVTPPPDPSGAQPPSTLDDIDEGIRRLFAEAVDAEHGRDAEADAMEP